MQSLSDFDYHLPKELIAQYPSNRRGEDRLLVLDRKKRIFEERNFREIVDYFEGDELLIFNDTKVIPARLYGRRRSGAGVEIFVLDIRNEPTEALVKPSRRIKENETIFLESGEKVVVKGMGKIGRIVEFSKDIMYILRKGGHVPLPPYISRKDELLDRQRYQTIFAKYKGATAAPTAGLHFTEEVIEKIKKKGVKIAYITLHVSYGTFAPIKELDIKRHKMHPEYYIITGDNVILIYDYIRAKKKIFACGTTVLRTLETVYDRFKERRRIEGWTDLFIYPGYKFKAVDALITNFHLPRSTLILLTSAFTGKELLFNAYNYAVGRKFRFFSYGDCMLII